ncbi:MAG: pseudouridine synthase [Burkholderiales bacterium]
MATLKLKSKPPTKGPKDRAPARSGAPRPRPTLAQAKAEREREPGAAEPTEAAKRYEAREASSTREREAARPSDARPTGQAQAPRETREAYAARAARGRPEQAQRTPTAPKMPRHNAPEAGRAAPKGDRATRDARRPFHPSDSARGAPPLRRGDHASTRDAPSQPPHPPHRTAPAPTPIAATHDGSLRLSKRMSELGIASRREADEWIPKGWVRVDGRVVAELGSRVLPDQHITIDAKARFQQAQRVTVLLNKPVGWVSGQAEDGYEPAIVLVKPGAQWREDHSGIRFLPEHLRGIAPAGRLDIDSVGLLVFTQDGRIARQLIGEDSEVEKEYLVRVEPGSHERLSDESLALLNHGLDLDGVALRPATVEWVNEDQLRFMLREGKKRQIRRMCEAVGLKVTGLKRVRIGNVMLGDLPTGQWRYLRLDEQFE